MFQTRVVEKTKNTYYVQYSPYPPPGKTRRLWDNVEKCGRTRKATDGNIIQRRKYTICMSCNKGRNIDFFKHKISVSQIQTVQSQRKCERQSVTGLKQGKNQSNSHFMHMANWINMFRSDSHCCHYARFPIHPVFKRNVPGPQQIFWDAKMSRFRFGNFSLVSLKQRHFSVSYTDV
jgi:hypothetical protein